MKKMSKFLSLGLLACSIVGCSCSKDSTIESVLENSKSVYEGGKTNITLSSQDIYDYMRTNNVDNVNKAFLTYLMEAILDFENNPNNLSTYNLKVEDYFKETFVESSAYKINGVFNEDLLASSLESNLYIVDKVNKPQSGPTVSAGLKYDYSDYINRALNYDLYLEILKEDYIVKERSSLLDNSKTRIISIFSTGDLDEMEEIVNDLFEGEYEDLEAVSTSKKEEEKKEIGRQFCVNLGLEDGIYYDGECSASTSSSTYDSALYKFTVCENGLRCNPYDGLAYQIGLIDKTEYVTEQVVNKDTTDILYTEALEQLLRTDVKEHLHEVIEGQDYFLVNGLYNNDSEFSNKDIILSQGPDSTYYLVTVRVVDSTTQDIKDKERALAMLLDKVNSTVVISHYLKKLNITIDDPELQSYYNSLIGE